MIKYGTIKLMKKPKKKSSNVLRKMRAQVFQSEAYSGLSARKMDIPVINKKVGNTISAVLSPSHSDSERGQMAHE
jgi:hypothetical protein